METHSWLGFNEPFSSFSHMAMAIFGLVGAFFYYKKGKGNSLRVFSLMVFSFCIVFLFSMSGVFHLLPPGTSKSVLQRLDHSGIWLMIAGTFTPLHIIIFRGLWRWLPLLFVWTVAITGLVLQVIFFDSFPEWLTLSLFLGLGWFGFFSMMKFKSLFKDSSLKWLVGGGILYSIGAVIDFAKGPILIDGVLGAHEIFHIFVILGALSHWWFIYQWAGHPTKNTIVFRVQIFPDSRFVAKALGEQFLIHAQSMDALKEKIKEKVRLRYHRTIQPQVQLQFVNEEHFSLS